ncbi:hypothetical protein ACF3DV_26240 [Chlorogloeopsis fritschii PCC 9212]|uniref:hypothetical protein n=1 Tax=Chlorogloeopsis fritschii TaxID=1124 RepID=UPI0003006E5B|nr:hypothetical protein [Chlorogloeopsis fritschii]
MPKYGNLFYEHHNNAHLTYALLNQEEVGIAPNMEISSMNITAMPTLRIVMDGQIFCWEVE